jgi:hypothetical protein
MGFPEGLKIKGRKKLLLCRCRKSNGKIDRRLRGGTKNDETGGMDDFKPLQNQITSDRYIMSIHV